MKLLMVRVPASRRAVVYVDTLPGRCGGGCVNRVDRTESVA